MKEEISFEFISHASVLVTSGNFTLITDPWFGFPFHFDTFHCYPPFSYDIKALVERINVIHISHLHQDHFCKKSLSYFPKNTPILISKYKSPFFKNQLKDLGFENIVVIASDLLSSVEMGGMKLRTIQAEKNETSFDSSLLITTESGETFLLANDCYLGINQINAIKKHIGKIKGAFLGYTDISPYPTCFDFKIKNSKDILNHSKIKKINDCKLICKELEVLWAVPYANDLRFIKEEIFKHNRIYESLENFYDLIKGTHVLNLKPGAAINGDGKIISEPNVKFPPELSTLKIQSEVDLCLDEQFQFYEEKIFNSLHEHVKKISKTWKLPMNIQFIINHRDQIKKINFNNNRISHENLDPDLILKYDFAMIKKICDSEMSWQQLHLTYNFEAIVLNEIFDQTLSFKE